MKKILYVAVCGLLLCILSCRNYVEIPPENTRVLENTSDYQSLLYYGTLFDASYTLPIYSGDDAGTDEESWQDLLSFQTGLTNAYTWADRLYGANIEDQDWNKFYNQIFNCNTVIDGVMTSKNGTQEEKEKALSDALVHRAYAYYTLVNMYARQYDPATASTDMGLPLVLHPKFNTDLTRSSVQKTYDQIEADLNQALPNLPDLPDISTNPSKVAVHAMLARMYLNTREFAEAEREANAALSFQSTLIDLNDYITDQSAYPNRLTNPEQIFFKIVGVYPRTHPLNNNAISLFDTADLRFRIFTADKAKSGANFNNRSYFGQRIPAANDGVCVGPSVPEMMLIKAECEARAGNSAAAVDVLNSLRKKRFKPADYSALTVATPNEALHLVADERVREFIGRGFRWFDQRRLSEDPGFIPTVTRVFQGATYTLVPGSNRYTYAIADRLITLNPEIIQNPR